LCCGSPLKKEGYHSTGAFISEKEAVKLAIDERDLID
jgi:hypothetical protein